MLEKYKGKNVCILISTNSGAGTSVSTQISESHSIFNPIFKIFGKVEDFDKEFLELKDTKTIIYDGFKTGSKVIGGNKIEPSYLENKSVLIKKEYIISILETN